MKTEPAKQTISDQLEQKIAGLHFFKEVGRSDPEQLAILIAQSHIIYASPGEAVIESGDKDELLYFLMRGELQVLAPGKNKLLGRLIAGEVFGDISVIANCPRTTNIVVPDKGREAVILALDFSELSDLRNHSVITLPTKLIVYRQIVHMLRWRSDLYRIRFPRHELAAAPYETVRVKNNKAPQEELYELSAQANYLARRLQRLNKSLGAINSLAAKDYLLNATVST